MDFLLFRLIFFYIISIATTKEVHTKGRRSVSHGQCVMMARIKAAVDRKNISQATAFVFFDLSIFWCSIFLKIFTKIGVKNEN
jgi:hypothetical protein